jgi:hypothetical protein
MALKRRQFLRAISVFGGVGLAGCMHQAMTPDPIAPVSPVALSPPPTPSPTPKPSPGLLEQQGIFNPPRGDVRIVVISDLNSQYGSTEYEPEVDRAIALLPGWSPDLVLCGGDMVAGQSPSLTKPQIQAMWEAFDQHVGVPLRRANIPYGFTMGNHDASGALGINGGFLFNKERDLAAAHWNDPRHNPGVTFVDKTGYPFYYTFLQNDIFFLVWDASTGQIPASQIAWAERSLASPIAQAAKLRMAIGHLPLYAVSVGRDDPGEYLDRADELRSLLERHHVHTYISGHHHAYYPGHVGQLQTLHSGILGSGVRPLLGSDLPPMKTLTVIDVDLEKTDTVYTTYNATTFQIVDQKSLPRAIAGPNGTVLRRDVDA